MNRADTQKRFEEEYLDKIFGFCCQKTNSKADAEDLASQITLEVWKTIHAEKQIENLGAFVWSVSNHIFFKWLRAKKHGTTAYLDALFVSSENPEEAYLRLEAENSLHREIAMLSENYRKAVVLYYFEGKRCSEIGKILGKSTGTVKWWLHDARNLIKKGLDTMRKYGEKSYHPGTLFMSCQGMPGADNQPMSCAKRMLPQNILLAAYEIPLSVEQLCTELGTPAAYVEDEVKNLVFNQLMKESPAGLYQTDFVILPAQDTAMAHKLYASCFPSYYETLIRFLETHKTLLTGRRFNTANFSWGRLLWVYIHIVTDIALSRFKQEVCKKVAYSDMPERPDGGKWIALGFDRSQRSHAAETERREYVPFDGPVHKTGREYAQGYFHYWSGLDSSVFFDMPDGVFALCREIIKGNLSPHRLSEEQKFLFSKALENKLFIKNGDGFRQNYYFIEKQERKQLEQLAYAFYPQANRYFDKAYRQIFNAYKTMVPKRLHWQMGNFLSNFLGHFITCSLYEGIRNHIPSEPDEANREWLSLFASE